MNILREEGLLPGIKILDLADEKASFCSKLLADLGAYVLKVEKPEGDPSRRIGPFIENSTDREGSLFFFYNNTNKSGITLDLESEGERARFLSLIREFDVMVETYPPGHLDKLDLGYGVLKEVNPGLILVSITGFGQDGPRSGFKSCDLVASACGGQMYVSGLPSKEPLKPFGEQSYYISSLFAAIGIMLALRRRNLTGKGDHIDISLQEAVISSLEHVLVQYFYNKTIPKRQGSLHWDNSFCILPCKDGYIFLSIFQQWDTLVEWMDSEGMAEDLREEKYREEEFRRRNIGHIIEVLEKWTKTHPLNELFELGQLMRFPWASVSHPGGVLENPQLIERGFFIDIEHPEIKKTLKYPGIPYKFTYYSPKSWERAPSLGEQNSEIFRTKTSFSET